MRKESQGTLFSWLDLEGSRNQKAPLREASDWLGAGGYRDNRFNLATVDAVTRYQSEGWIVVTV